MKSRETLLRLKRFQADERRRRLGQIETMMAEFERMAADLDREILGEEERAGIHDTTHFAYPTYARAASQRRDNLRRSADELRGQLDEAREQLDAALEELNKAEALEQRDRGEEAPVERPPSRRAGYGAVRSAV
jgi:flagellar export protein FliJ